MISHLGPPQLLTCNLARLVGFNKPKAQQFYDLLGAVYNKNMYSTFNIYDMNQTAL